MGSIYQVPDGCDSRPAVPVNGAIKESEGFVRQLFNENGELIYQEFIIPTGEGCEYFDHERKSLDYEEDDKRLDFYSPYDMVQPEKPVNLESIAKKYAAMPGSGASDWLEKRILAALQEANK